MSKIHHKSKCQSCGYWSIHISQIDVSPIIDTCTACKNKSFIKTPLKKYMKIINDSKRSIKILEASFPTLRDLRSPGDSIKVPHQD